MGGTELTTGKMNTVANNLDSAIKRYNQCVSRIYEIGTEIDAMWDGEASNKFSSILGSDKERFNALTTLLKRYTEVLCQDISIYIKAEQDALQILNTNKIR